MEISMQRQRPRINLSSEYIAERLANFFVTMSQEKFESLIEKSQGNALKQRVDENHDVYSISMIAQPEKEKQANHC